MPAFAPTPALSALAWLAAASLLAAQPRLELTTEREPATGTTLRRGTFEVPENRTAKGGGRRIRLHVVVLNAVRNKKRADPIFWLAGGPGQGATASAQMLARSWLRDERDIVLVDQRGTGRSNPLHVALLGSDQNLQGYLDPLFQEAPFRAALERLARLADLTQYGTEQAADDLDELRAALGYERINLIGGSYGTRAALVYMRRHEARVRAAVLNGAAPIAFKNPLYHPRAAQEGFDALRAEVLSDTKLRAAYGDLGRTLRRVLERLSAKPAAVTIPHPRTAQPVEVVLDHEAFAEALRVMLYSTATNRAVPELLLRAAAGDLRAFAERAVASNRALRDQLALGMLMCVVGAEDIARIDPAEIAGATAGTFLGDARVRAQLAVAAFWPRGEVSADYGEPVRVDTPVLVLSGTHDPVTPPRWGTETARHLPNARHLVVPGCHGVGGDCVNAIVREFLDRGSAKRLDTSCIKRMRLPSIPLPAISPAKKRAGV